MGYYIQGPNKSKAQYIVSEYDGKIVPAPEKFSDVPADKAIICVVDNGPFEAAAFAYDEREFDAFKGDENGHDRRPRKWVIMDRAKAIELTGYDREAGAVA